MKNFKKETIKHKCPVQKFREISKTIFVTEEINGYLVWIKTSFKKQEQYSILNFYKSEKDAIVQAEVFYQEAESLLNKLTNKNKIILPGRTKRGN